MQSERERQELYKTIWNVANELRGELDGWDFKNYVLGMLFYRFISENFSNFINANERNENTSFDYSTLSDEEAEQAREVCLQSKGFFILPSELFNNVIEKCKDEDYKSNLNEHLSNIFKNIQSSTIGQESEANFKDLFDDIDVNSKKLGDNVESRNKKLLKIMLEIKKFDFSHEDSQIDAFGDAYEYLMTMYTSAAGKSGGQHFTPQEVSELLARLTLLNNPNPNKVYDPACGSGSLLLKFKKILQQDPPQGYFGQEINITTYNLCRINMFLHNVNFTKFNIALGDTLLEPKHLDYEPFDAIVSNPPYSIKWEGDSNPALINDPRFSPAGVLAPKSKADLAFSMHMLSWLSNTGSAAIVEFPGVLYRGGAEATIREYLIRENYIDCVIALAENLFFGTNIATCIIVLKKNKINDTSILFIDASDEFIKATNKNKLDAKNIESILELYKDRKDVEHKSRLVSLELIKENAYNLSVSSYVEKKDTNEIVNIKELNLELKEIVAKQNELRNKIDSIVAQLECEA